MEEEDLPLNSAREIGLCSPAAGDTVPQRPPVVPFALLYLQRPTSSEEKPHMQLYAFCTPCLPIDGLAGAFLTLCSVTADLQRDFGSLTLRLQATDGQEAAVLLFPDKENRCMVLALPVLLQEALKPLCLQLNAFLIALSGSLEAAFKEKSRMDSMCRRLAALVRPQPTWEILRLLQPAAVFCPLQDVVRAKLQAMVVHLEAGFDMQTKPLGTCAFFRTELLFSHLSEEHLQFTLRFLHFHVFGSKRPARELLQERFKTISDRRTLSLQVVIDNETCLCAVMETGEEEPAVESAHQLRACLREMIAAIRVSSTFFESTL